MARRITRTVGKISFTNKLTYGVWNKRIPRKYKKWLKSFDLGMNRYCIFLEEYSNQPAFWKSLNHNGKIPYKQNPHRILK